MWNSGSGTQIEWSVRGGGALRNVDSARVSVPSTLRYQEDKHWSISPFLLYTVPQFFVMTISLVFFATLFVSFCYNIHSIGAAAMSGGHVWRTLKPIGEAGIFLNSIHLISMWMDSTYQLQMFIYNIFVLAVFLCEPENLFAADMSLFISCGLCFLCLLGQSTQEPLHVKFWKSLISSRS